jgi:autotransporter-associated beta strand protein
MTSPCIHRRPPLAAAALLAALALAGCSSSHHASGFTVPAAPPDLGYTDAAPAPAVTTAFVDGYQTNLSANKTVAANSALALLSGFSDLWETGTTWDTGTALDLSVLRDNVAGSVDVTTTRTDAQAIAAYLDDRRNQSYTPIDGLGPLADLYRTGAGATTTIPDAVPADATTVLYSDGGTGGGTTTSSLGSVVTLVNTLRGNYSSTTPGKNFFLYPRPWRLDDDSAVVATGATETVGTTVYPVYQSSVVVVPALLPARSTTPATDSGFPSGHTNAGYLAGLALAYAVPERFSEVLTRVSTLGQDRVVAGMHSPLDVMGGRMLGTALAAAILYDSANAAAKAAAYTQAHTYLEAQTGTDASTFYAYAHSADTTTDPYADHDANRALYRARLTNGFAPIASTTAEMTVPKGAEVLLETRLPYLDATQRRVVLRTTGLPSGTPLLDDAEGWGRLDLVAAADGYAELYGDVVVAMDASLGGFNAADRWRNDISGTGKLTKKGTGALALTGTNTYTGGTQVVAGTLEGDSASAFGRGDLYLADGTVIVDAPTRLAVGGDYTQLAGTLELVLGANGQGHLAVTGTATLAGGTLHVAFADGFTPTVGSVVNVVTAGYLQGKFTALTVDGHTATVSYTSTGVQLRIDG